MALIVEVKEGGVWGAAVKGAILRCICIHHSGTNENQGAKAVPRGCITCVTITQVFN